ncbi:MAG: hypothetical protein ACLQDL_15085 [Spirochaetia bacterium]
MGELKSCLFCGKSVDEAFDYCPHCGCEFGQGEDKSAFAAEYGGDLPGLIEETTGECVPAGDDDYLHRLRTLQEVLTDMERELDLIIAMDGEVGRGQGWPKGRSSPRTARSGLGRSLA